MTDIELFHENQFPTNWRNRIINLSLKKNKNPKLTFIAFEKNSRTADHE